MSQQHVLNANKSNSIMTILGVASRSRLCLMPGKNLHIPRFFTWLWMSPVENDIENLEEV